MLFVVCSIFFIAQIITYTVPGKLLRTLREPAGGGACCSDSLKLSNHEFATRPVASSYQFVRALLPYPRGLDRPALQGRRLRVVTPGR